MTHIDPTQEQHARQVQLVALSILIPQLRLRLDRALALAAILAGSAVAARGYDQQAVSLALAVLCVRELFPAARLMRMLGKMLRFHQHLSRV